MSKETETMKHNAEVAQFRFALIAPVIQGLFPDASATAYYKRVSAAPLTLPDGTSVKYSYKTLEKWKSLYSTGGLDALMPVSRSDKGTSRLFFVKYFSLKKASKFPVFSTGISLLWAGGIYASRRMRACSIR